MRTIRAVGEERHRAGLAQELADARRRSRVAPDDLARDDPVERQIAQLEDLAHAARAEPFDGLKPLELRQRPAGAARGLRSSGPDGPPSSATVIDW